MPAPAAFVDGIRRVNRAPVVLAGMFAVTLMVALPLAIALRGMIARHLGSSLAAEAAASGANSDWWQEFSAQAVGLATTFVPTIIGFGAVLENLSGFLDNARLAATVAGATTAWLVIWSFLSGGVLDRLARNRATRAHGFFSACGVHFWRFLRLGLVAWAAYYLLFEFAHQWLLVDAFQWATEDVNVERTAFVIRLSGYAVFGVLLVAVNVLFDYARVRIVVEDRRSALGALVAGARFIRRNWPSVAALYLLNGVAFLLLVFIYAIVAPGASAGAWLMLLVGEAYILGRHYLKLVVYGSEAALFQRSLAHAAYTAAPLRAWPDSPAVEAIVNAGPPASA
jgi:hypothetical protein